MYIKYDTINAVQDTEIKNGTYIVPNKIQSIGCSAFYHLKNLKKVVIPSSVTFLASYSFYYCENLKSIIIPDSVTNIGYEAFSGCSGLESVVISKNTICFGANMFLNCEKLKSTEYSYKAFHIDDKDGIYTEPYGMLRTNYELNKKVTMHKNHNDPIRFCTNLYDIIDLNFDGIYDKDFVVCICKVGNILKKSNFNSSCETDEITPFRRLTREEFIKLLNKEL